MLLVLAFSASCRQEMYDQPKYKDLRRSDFFPDQRQARPLPPGTVPRGFLRDDSRISTGRAGAGGTLVTEFPMPVDAAMLLRGRERYDIYCSPCHDRTGSGGGMVVKRGYQAPPSFHVDRLRNAPVGHLFDVMTNGFGAMPDYSSQLDVNDRWAVVAYVRALQLSQSAPVAAVAASDRVRLEGVSTAPVPPGAPLPAGVSAAPPGPLLVTPTPGPAPFPIPAGGPESR